MNSKIKNIPKKYIYVLSFILILLFAFLLNINETPKKHSSDNKPSSAEERLNLDPPTEQDIINNSENKMRIDSREQQIKDASIENKKLVLPAVTRVDLQNDSIEVSSYISGVFEDGGVCTIYFAKDTLTNSKNVYGVKEGSSVFCPLVKVPLEEFSQKGTWSVYVEYYSVSSYGKSTETKVEIK